MSSTDKMVARFAHGAALFKPFTFSDNNWVFALPARVGATPGKARREFKWILGEYIEEDLAPDELRGKAEWQDKVDTRANDYIDALKRNGYDAKSVMKSAEGNVRGRYYAKFYEAVYANDEEGTLFGVPCGIVTWCINEGSHELPVDLNVPVAVVETGVFGDM